MAFPLGAVGILNSVFFGVYGNLLRQWYPDVGSGKSETPSYTAVFLAGGLAGAVQAIPACPIDLVKVRLQAQTGETDDRLETDYSSDHHSFCLDYQLFAKL